MIKTSYLKLNYYLTKQITAVTYHFIAILFESLITKSAYRFAETSHLWINPCITQNNRLPRWMFFVNDFFSHALTKKMQETIAKQKMFCFLYHHFCIPQVTGIRYQRPVFRVYNRFFDNLHVSCCDKAFGPFWNGICLAEKSFTEKFAVFNFAMYRVLR